MKHTITEVELIEILASEVWNVICSSSGNGSHKKLEANNVGALRVTDHGRVVYSGLQTLEAVRAYNAAE